MTGTYPLEFNKFIDSIVNNIESFSHLNQSSKEFDRVMTNTAITGGEITSSVHNLSVNLSQLYNKNYISALKNVSLQDIISENNLHNVGIVSAKDIMSCFFNKKHKKFCLRSFQDNPLCVHVLSEIDDNYFVENLNDVIKKIYFSCGSLFKKAESEHIPMSTLLRLGTMGHNFFESGDWRLIMISAKHDEPEFYRKQIKLLDGHNYDHLPKNVLVRKFIPGRINKSNIVKYICLMCLTKLLFRLTPKKRIRESVLLENAYFLKGLNS